MHTKRTIALIGTGSLGQALAFALVKGNNFVLLFSKLDDDAEAAAASIKNKNAFADIEAMPCSYTASWEADIIITAIPSSELKEFFLYIKDVSVQKILVVGEVVNEYNRNFLNDVDEAQKILPFTKIIKTSFAINKDGAIEYFIEANNKDAIETIHNLFKEAGLLSQLKSLSN